jgi:hypothetical protein
MLAAMQSVEDFMHELFEAHANVERAKLAAYRQFRDRFFVDGYQPFSSNEYCHSCEAEKIESVASSDSSRVVTTSTVFMSFQPRLRYYLERRADSWAVAKVESFCKVCDGKGRIRDEKECSRCKGKGWEILAAS